MKDLTVLNKMVAGLFIFLPVIRHYGIDKAIENSSYPFTKDISRISSILCFLALKLSNVKRYSKYDLWCMDRGIGLFAGLNVLPKTAWFSSYSSRITSEMNLSFLKSLHNIWVENGLLSDTVNLDFTTIPYWGDASHPENNRSGKRNKALSFWRKTSKAALLIMEVAMCNIKTKRQWFLSIWIFTNKHLREYKILTI
jgi:hypothetical protein